MLFFRWSWTIIVICLIFAGGVGADSVYSWTDENGVRVFSDTPPDASVKDLTETEKIETDEAKEQQSKENYNRMVKQANQQSEEEFEAVQEKNARIKAEQQENKDHALKQKIDAEMQRLEAEIVKIQSRGLGPNFTQGMKDNLTNQVQEKMAELSASPEAYFNP